MSATFAMHPARQRSMYDRHPIAVLRPLPSSRDEYTAARAGNSKLEGMDAA